ncbi:MAG: lytic transglycosylase domain-containing protein [Desulfobulbus sp.]|nr:lytic transglycosylase domain-containing protein [Desulfobulbus sp.]
MTKSSAKQTGTETKKEEIKEPKKPAAKRQTKGSNARGRSKNTRRKKRSRKPKPPTRQLIAWTIVEVLSLVVTAITGIIVLLGYSAARFSGSEFFAHLLPFATGVLAMMLVFAVLLTGWIRLRAWLQQKKVYAPAMFALFLVLIGGILTIKGDLFFAFSQFRILIGGKEEAGRATLTHQVYAAYRRVDADQLLQLIERAKPYREEISAAASAFRLDPDLLLGLAATESSFLPRESKDGGQGLFQITQIPEAAVQEADRSLGVDKPLASDHRHNGYLAAATLTHYLKQMNGDLFLGLLAYNIGPKNGGLRSIMQQYGATDFVTIQPYLQKFPRDYPIRTLCNGLAFRLFRKEGKLLAYEEGLNAVRIQHIGIPGL